MDDVTIERVSRPRRWVRAVRAMPSNMPLRVQLIVAVLVLVFAGLVISNVAGTKALRGYLLNRVDGQLVSTTQDTFHSGQVDSGGGGAPFFNDHDDGPALATSFFTELTDSTGHGQGELRVPYGVDQSAPKLPSLAMPLSNSVTGHSLTVSSRGNGSDWRILVTPLPDGSGALTVGTTLSDVNNTVARLQLIDIWVSLIVLAVLGIVGSLVVTNSLRRLSQVEQTANAIASGDMSHRAPEWSNNTEVGRLAHSFNTMLERIEQAFAAQSASETEARESEERMRRFIADASHELRTPLTSIRGFAELRRQGAANSPELVDHSLERIESEAQRMTLLVEDLLLLARLDQQRPLAQEPVDVRAVVNDVVEPAPVVAPDHPLTVEDGGDSPLIVVGDETRLHQVFANIVNNAFTHTPSGTPVDIKIGQDAGEVVVQITDHGVGMLPEEARRVFERFYRADPARTRAQGGTGLGLSIVAGIVEAHGGTVEVKTAPGEGASFTVRIPLMPVDQSNEAELSER